MKLDDFHYQSAGIHPERRESDRWDRLLADIQRDAKRHGAVLRPITVRPFGRVTRQNSYRRPRTLGDLAVDAALACLGAFVLLCGLARRGRR